MIESTKDRMISGAADLLARKGLQETSFSTVLAYTGAPRGSIYHHFPEGKSQMVAAAMHFAGDRAARILETTRGKHAEEVAATFFDLWRQLLVATGFQAGCSVLAVTVAADSEELRADAGSIFTSWVTLLESLLHDGGLSPESARNLAPTLLASSEGAVVLARSAQGLDDFERVAQSIINVVKASRLAGS